METRAIFHEYKSFISSSFDYIALGHIHKPAILIRDTAAYSGSLEPVDRNEMGAHGYIEGHIENGRLRTRFVPFASRAYEQIILTLHEDTTQLSLEEMLKEEIYRRGGLNIYRVILRGFGRGASSLSGKLKTMGNIIEVQDESKPAYDLEDLLCRYNGTLIGDYISISWTKRTGVPWKKKRFITDFRRFWKQADNLGIRGNL